MTKSRPGRLQQTRQSHIGVVNQVNPRSIGFQKSADSDGEMGQVAGRRGCGIDPQDQRRRIVARIGHVGFTVRQTNLTGLPQETLANPTRPSKKNPPFGRFAGSVPRVPTSGPSRSPVRPLHDCRGSDQTADRLLSVPRPSKAKGRRNACPEMPFDCQEPRRPPPQRRAGHSELRSQPQFPPAKASKGHQP